MRASLEASGYGPEGALTVRGAAGVGPRQGFGGLERDGDRHLLGEAVGRPRERESRDRAHDAPANGLVGESPARVARPRDVAVGLDGEGRTLDASMLQLLL